MRCLIIGASGQVGGQLVSAAADRGLTFLGTAYRRPHPDYVPLDLRDGDAVDDLIEDLEPDVTFLPAAMTYMDYAEGNEVECAEVNVAGVRTVAEAVARTGGRLVFFSTDHVFGECPHAMQEDDPTAPQSVYARTKLFAETAVRNVLPDQHLILRTSWVFGPDESGKNFARSLVRRLGQGETVRAANDQFGQPTYGPDLADVAMELVKLEAKGTFHAVGPDRHTKFTFARLVAHLFGFDADLVVGVPGEELEQDAPRPKQVWIDRYKLRQVLGPHAIRRPGEGLRALRDSLRPVRMAA
ncbi:MAG TPA: SDR family oxidoreductase [Fimbriiglobus sp.]|jgi:dTDP-4-dehydrorhamnose reductase